MNNSKVCFPTALNLKKKAVAKQYNLTFAFQPYVIHMQNNVLIITKFQLKVNHVIAKTFFASRNKILFPLTKCIYFLLVSVYKGRPKCFKTFFPTRLLFAFHNLF